MGLIKQKTAALSDESLNTFILAHLCRFGAGGGLCCDWVFFCLCVPCRLFFVKVLKVLLTFYVQAPCHVAVGGMHWVAQTMLLFVAEICKQI